VKLTICGSARYEAYWHEANKQLGLAGHICYALMTYPSVEGEKTWYTPEQKWTLDLAHLAKIEESDGVVMLNIEGYLGESSLRELEWARMRHKKIYWTLEDERRRTGDMWAKHLASVTPVFPYQWLELIEAVKKRQFAIETAILKS
jgi:hypothetical protein